MQHLDGPGVHSNILARDDEYKHYKQDRHDLHLLRYQQRLNIGSQEEENDAHDQLGWNDPAAALPN